MVHVRSHFSSLPPSSVLPLPGWPTPDLRPHTVITDRGMFRYSIHPHARERCVGASLATDNAASCIHVRTTLRHSTTSGQITGNVPCAENFDKWHNKYFPGNSRSRAHLSSVQDNSTDVGQIQRTVRILLDEPIIRVSANIELKWNQMVYYSSKTLDYNLDDFVAGL